MNLPGYSPDFNADEAIWDWVREAATGNLCLGTKSRVRERVGNFLTALAESPPLRKKKPNPDPTARENRFSLHGHFR